MSQHKHVSRQSLGSGTLNGSRQFLLLARSNRKSSLLPMPRTAAQEAKYFQTVFPVSMSQQEKPRTRAKYFQTVSPVSTSQQEKPRTTSVELISHHSARMHIIPVCTLFPGIIHQRREYTSADANPIPM